MSTAITSKELVEKSLQAALAAIEIYNKPDFRYREETFAILMCTSWELLLKAKTMAECGEAFDSLVVTRTVRNETTGQAEVEVKRNRSGNAPHAVMLTIETKVVKGKGADAIPVRWTNDPAAPAMRIREEDLLERYPCDSIDLRAKLRERYSDFKQDKRFFRLKKPLESDHKYCRVRYLDPKNPKSGSKKFFSPETFKVFDLHYKRKE
jgi:hypothetical protein